MIRLGLLGGMSWESSALASGADGIVLGCTELELLITPDDSPVPLLPTTRLHVEAAVARACAV